jgi:SPP1 gp7 family putative phage head morphogenesis protein
MPNDLNNAITLEAIRAAIASNNPSGGAIGLQWGNFVGALDKTIPTLANQIAASANISAAAMPKSIQIASSFTATDPRAIAWAQQRAGARILGITKESQKAVAETIARGLQGKLNREEVIDGVTRVVGLDSRQARALGTFYEKNLNALLDDGMSYENAARAAKKLGERYRTRLIKQRATRIARTETNAAANAGRLLSWAEADQQGFLPTGSEKRWKTSQDERNCPTCRPMHNETVPWEGLFSTGDIMPPVHVNCLCTAVIVPAEAEFNKSVYTPIKKTRKTAWLFAKHGSHNQKTHGGKGGGGSSSLGDYATPTKEGKSEYAMRERFMEDSFQSDEQREAFAVAAQEWQGEGYRRVQSGLLSDNPSPEAQSVIDEFDAAMMPFDSDEVGYLYRGQTEGLDNLNVGDSFTSPLFQATTTDPITAASFSKSSGGVTGGVRQGESATILRIDSMGASGVVIPDSSEFEVVLNRGTQFNVEDITEEVINGVTMKIIEVSTGG